MKLIDDACVGYHTCTVTVTMSRLGDRINSSSQESSCASGVSFGVAGSGLYPY